MVFTSNVDGGAREDFNCLEPLKIWGFPCFPNRPVLATEMLA